MPLLDAKMAILLDGLKKAVAECEARLANGRLTSKKFHPEVMKTQANLVTTLNLLKDTLEQIELSHEVIATSHVLLAELKQFERPFTDQAHHRKQSALL